MEALTFTEAEYLEVERFSRTIPKGLSDLGTSQGLRQPCRKVFLLSCINRGGQAMQLLTLWETVWKE